MNRSIWTSVQNKFWTGRNVLICVFLVLKCEVYFVAHRYVEIFVIFCTKIRLLFSLLPEINVKQHRLSLKPGFNTYLLLKCNLHEVYCAISNIKITLAVCEFRSFNIRYLQLMLRVFSGEILKIK